MAYNELGAHILVVIVSKEILERSSLMKRSTRTDKETEEKHTLWWAVGGGPSVMVHGILARVRLVLQKYTHARSNVAPLLMSANGTPPITPKSDGVVVGLVDRILSV